MLQGSYFAVDATPKVGTPLAYDVHEGALDPLYLRGFVFLPENEPPFVVCALDWIGIAALSLDRLKQSIADAVGTKKESVSVHSIHFHDAPDSNLTCENLLKTHGLGKAAATRYDSELLERVCESAYTAAKSAVKKACDITHIGASKAPVHQVASNRRILGEDGKVAHTRYSACKDKSVADMPEGLIDPNIDLLSFWNRDRLLATASYYATHPMSYYRTGMCSSDFVGMARDMFTQMQTGAPHIYFNGAGGNITAGKYNNGEKHMRFILAKRLYSGLSDAWEIHEKAPVEHVFHHTPKLQMPINDQLDFAGFEKLLQEGSQDSNALLRAARALAYRDWDQQSDGIDTLAVELNNSVILHMPGELFVEYQLYAKDQAPDMHVCMAAYGEYGPGYIGISRSYDEGGYETAPGRPKVAKNSEPIIKKHLVRMLASNR